MFVCNWEHECHGVHVKSSRQLEGVGFLFPPYKFLGLNSVFRLGNKCLSLLSHLIRCKRQV